MESKELVIGGLYVSNDVILEYLGASLDYENKYVLAFRCKFISAFPIILVRRSDWATHKWTSNIQPLIRPLTRLKVPKECFIGYNTNGDAEYDINGIGVLTIFDILERGWEVEK